MQQVKYVANASNFSKIPGSPIAYWASNTLYQIYINPPLSTFVNCKSGIMTGDDSFIHLWYEVSNLRIAFYCRSYLDMGTYKWFPLNSGGDFRKWYGNNSKIVNLENDGAEIKAKVKNYRLREKKYYFQEGLTWGRITSAEIAFRIAKEGSLFGDAGPVGFVSRNKEYILAFLCSRVVKSLLKISNPTLNFQIHDIMNLPLVLRDEIKTEVEELVNTNISISKKDWDSFETSWDFKKHPLI